MTTPPLSAVQDRTVRDLFGAGVDRPEFRPDLAEGLRTRIEAPLEGLGLDPASPLRLWKGRLGKADRCHGLLQSDLMGEGEVGYPDKAAVGSLLHKAVELDVVSGSSLDPAAVCERAAGRLHEGSERFAAHWDGLDTLDRAEMLAESGRRVMLLRATLPPLRPWAPACEARIEARLLGGGLILSGRPDLLVGPPAPDSPNRATRLAIDLKSGIAWPEHAADMRFYALLMALRFGVPPFRVATLYLESGTWQAEDVDVELLRHEADRVCEVAALAQGLGGGAEPSLTPGPHCGWCPRSPVCPASTARRASEVSRE